jgi:hypothetical protein
MEDENAVQSRIQNAVTRMIDEIDMKKMRSFKQNIFLNIAKCYDNKTAPSSSVDQCARKFCCASLYC